MLRIPGRLPAQDHALPANSLQQRGGIHGLDDTAYALPVQVFQHTLPNPRLRLRNLDAKDRIHQEGGRECRMANIGHHIPYTKDMDASIRMGR
jgi:hypothetical protein